MISRFSTRGTFTGEMMGTQGTGQAFVTSNGIDICRIENGKVVEMWAMFDALGMLQQSGLLPSG